MAIITKQVSSSQNKMLSHKLDKSPDLYHCNIKRVVIETTGV